MRLMNSKSRKETYKTLYFLSLFVDAKFFIVSEKNIINIFLLFISFEFYDPEKN